MANELIKDAARQAGVRLWQVADKMGLADGNLSRRLRHELSETDRARVLQIIQDIAGEGDSSNGQHTA